MARNEDERGAGRGAEEVLRALQAEPADRQEAVTPVAGDEVLPERPLRALQASEGDRQEAATAVGEAEPAGPEAAVAGEDDGDLAGRPGDLLRTLRQQRRE
jgi:hypothetical protein